ncbi:MAG: hypothetical protein ICV85_11995 [Tolypothrix sp. T3-bin4]|nr:hypothetical protein [Tolypothrix sp. T3-bin4]
MSHITFSDTLILLRPDYLPSSHKVNESKEKLCTVINLLGQALAESSQQRALTTINLALDILGPVEIIETGETLRTNTSLKTWQIEDFDQFFRLKHVQARDPAECLVASILTAYRAWLELNCCTSHESAKLEVESQKNGFKSCVSLLARVFNLDLEENL